MTVPAPSPAAGRLWIVLAAMLWSLSGLFTRLLTTDTPLGLHEPRIEPLQVAFCRSLFAGLFFLLFVRRRHVRFRPAMPVMVVTFAAMNWLFVTAMMKGAAANAIFLQYTAPFWMYLASVWLLGEPSDGRAAKAMLVALVGVGVIVTGGPSDDWPVVAMGVGSGLTYAVVLVCLRNLRDQPSQWLTFLNHFGAAVLLYPFVAHLPWPRAEQLAFLAFFGVVQMALPYFLIARGLRTVSPQEAGTITLLEPLFTSVWAYLISPETDTPGWPTLIGGGLILAALAWRYAPRNAVRT